MGTFEKVHKKFRGIGYAEVLITFFMALYYNLLLAYSLVYLYYSFESPLPWQQDSVNGVIWKKVNLFL